MEALKTFKVPQVIDAPHNYPESMRRGGQVARGVKLWVDGGWGIDALLERHLVGATRPDRGVAGSLCSGGV